MTEVASSLIGKVVDSLFGLAKEEISYIWNCTENVNKVRDEAENLKHMKGRVEQQIKIANEKGDNLLNGVQEWMDKAAAQISMAEDFLQEEAIAKKTCLKIPLCVNLGTLHHFGKMAIDKTPPLQQTQVEGKTFESNVSVPTSSPGFLELLERKNLDDLDTQLSALKEVIKSVKDESIQIVGIYGKGGVGKTTLAKEVAAQVNNLFDEVVFVTVSQTVDVTNIQEEVETAAKRIKKGDKILIILDDLWTELKLDEVGIPPVSQHKNCKILLTSREKDVCIAMNAHSEIPIDSLPREEAWLFFKRVVGERVENDNHLKKVAQEVCHGCGGLPLILQAIGKTLRDENIESWETANAQLKKHAPSEINPQIRVAFTHLQLSYDHLKSETAKSCFLLCSMFPEDSKIPLERLAYYATGLEIFKDLDSLEDVRNGVQQAVKILKSSCLLDEYDELTTRMHDVVREVALLIACKGNRRFLVKAGKGLKKWQPRSKTVKSYTGISLMQNNICKLPDYELQIPFLDIFLIQENHNLSTIPDEFIQGVKEARVIDFENNDIVSLPQSLKQLTRLCMLNLGGNRSLEDITIVGELKELEILILSHTGIKEIPQQIGQLANLRRLEVKYCEGLSNIAPNVIKNFRWLEELHIGYHPVEKGNHNSLVEVCELYELAFLDLYVPHVNLIPEGEVFTRLKGFVIQIGGSEQIYKDVGVVHKKSLILGMPFLDILPLIQVKEFLKVCDGIVFESVASLNNMLPTMYCEGSDDLKRIMFSRCKNLLCLVDWNHLQTFLSPTELVGRKTNKRLFSKLEHLVLLQLDKLNVIWNCPNQYMSLNNLVTLEIIECPKLVRLFSASVACGLVNLQKLTVEKCECLKEVIWDGNEATSTSEIDTVSQITKIVFPCLVKISLDELTDLTSFYSGNFIIEYPSLLEVKIQFCERMEKWGYGTHDTPKLKSVNYVKEPSTIDDGLAKYRESQRQARHLQTFMLMSRAALHFINGTDTSYFVGEGLYVCLETDNNEVNAIFKEKKKTIHC